MKKIGLLFIVAILAFSCLFGTLAFAQEYTIGLSFPSFLCLVCFSRASSER